MQRFVAAAVLASIISSSTVKHCLVSSDQGFRSHHESADRSVPGFTHPQELDFVVCKLAGGIIKYTFDLKTARGGIKPSRSHNTSIGLRGNLSTKLTLNCSLPL